MKTPILGGYAVARSVNAADNRIINLYPEATPEGGKTSGFLTRCPGYKLLVNSVGDGPIRGLWQFGGFLYVVSGVQLYQVDASWAVTSIGTVSGSGPVSMSDNGEQLFVACNPRSYTYSVASNTFAEITDPDFPGAVTVGFINGYFVFNEPDSQKVWITSYQNGGSVDPLEFAYADANPDLLLSLMVNRNEIWMFGSTSTEVWYYSGDVDFPLARIQGAFNEIGCAAPYSVAKLDNTVFWLGSDPRGNAMVYKAVGYGAQRVSTHGIEKILQGYEYVGDAIGYSYQQEGHTFYVLTFPSANATWCFDAATGEWHQRASWKQGKYNRHRSNCQANFNNTIVLGDFQYGKLYEFDLEYYKDDVGTQRWLRSWRALPPNQNNLNRTAHHSLQLDMETGTKTIFGSVSVPAPPVSQTYNSKFSPIHHSSEITLTNNDLTLTRTAELLGWACAQPVKTLVNSRKRYCEFTVDSIDPSQTLTFSVNEARTATTSFDFYPPTNGVIYVAYGDGITYTNIIQNQVSTVDYSAFGNASAGDVIMMAIEAPTTSVWQNAGSSMGGTVWFGRNGVWINGDPDTSTGGTIICPQTSQPTNPYAANVVPMVSMLGSPQITGNFGGQTFAYALPTGFLAWNQDDSTSYNQFDLDYYANGNGANLTVGSNTIAAPSTLVPLTDYPFAVTQFSATTGKVYIEATGYAGYTNIDSPKADIFFALGEAGMLLNYQPSGRNLPANIEENVEGCAVRFVQPEQAGTYDPLSDLDMYLEYGAKWDPNTQSYSYSAGNINNIKAVRTGRHAMFAIDFDAGKFWVGCDGIWSGDPVAGTGEVWNFTPNTELYVYAGFYSIWAQGGFNTTFNFGPNFTYNIPSGYTPFNVDTFTTATSESTPKVLLRWSDDGGHTWSNYYEKELGSLGEYWTRVIWRRLGMTTKLRDRVYELTGSDPVKITITGAELILSGTNS